MNDNDNNNNSNSPFTISVLEEQVHLDKKLVEKATIEISKNILEEKETASINLFSEDVQINKFL